MENANIYELVGWLTCSVGSLMMLIGVLTDNIGVLVISIVIMVFGFTWLGIGKLRVRLHHKK